MIICAKKDLPTLVISTIWTNYSTYFILFLKKMIVFNPCHVMPLSHHKYHHRFLTFKMKAQLFEFHLTTQPCDDHALIKKKQLYCITLMNWIVLFSLDNDSGMQYLTFSVPTSSNPCKYHSLLGAPCCRSCHLDSNNIVYISCSLFVLPFLAFDITNIGSINI